MNRPAALPVSGIVVGERHRRDMGDIAALAASMAELGLLQPVVKGSENFATPAGKTSDKIGAFAGVSGRTVEKIAKVVDAAEQNPEKFGHLLDALDRPRGVDRAYQALRRTERMDRIAANYNGDSALPQDRKYPFILADPPWKFEVYDAESGIDSAADAHYPTMVIEDIAKLPVANLATRDAVLFLWSTAPHLPQVLEVLDAWGFQYVTNVIWVKDRAGLGYWVRNQHELLLIARRGDMPAPAPSARPSSVIHADRREHSRKPDEAYALIERMYPELPRIELFARQSRAGWDSWGNEAPYQARDDFAKSIDECYRAVRERVAAGGPPWVPK